MALCRRAALRIANRFDAFTSLGRGTLRTPAVIWGQNATIAGKVDARLGD